MTQKSVAIIVVTYNSQSLLADLVESIPRGTGGVISWQLIVADNDSRDATVETVRALIPNCTVVEMGRNAGYAAGINAAIDRAGDHDAFLIVNPDVRLGEDCIPRLLAALSAKVIGARTIGIAVPNLTDARGRLILSMRREPSVLRALGDAFLGAERAGRWPRLGEMVSDTGLYCSARLTDWAEGSTQLVSRECWQACGPWDESFFLYSEEAEFDLRARDRGFFTLYEPTAHAVHLEGGSAHSPRLWSLLQVNRVRLFGRRHGRLSTLAFWLATTFREASRALTGKPTSRAALRALVSPNRLRESPGPHSVS